LFVRLTATVPVVPSATVPKAAVVADRLVGAIPVPFSATVCEPLVGVVPMVKVPVSEVVDAGVKVTPMTQLAPAASELPQVVGAVGYGITAKLAPETLIDLIVMVADPAFPNVTVWAALASWTTWLPKPRVVGVTVVAALARAVENRQSIAVSDAKIAL
jgi:hypothetical protein